MLGNDPEWKRAGDRAQVIMLWAFAGFVAVAYLLYWPLARLVGSELATGLYGLIGGILVPVWIFNSLLFKVQYRIYRRSKASRPPS